MPIKSSYGQYASTRSTPQTPSSIESNQDPTSPTHLEHITENEDIHVFFNKPGRSELFEETTSPVMPSLKMAPRPLTNTSWMPVRVSDIPLKQTAEVIDYDRVQEQEEREVPEHQTEDEYGMDETLLKDFNVDDYAHEDVQEEENGKDTTDGLFNVHDASSYAHQQANYDQHQSSGEVTYDDAPYCPGNDQEFIGHYVEQEAEETWSESERGFSQPLMPMTSKTPPAPDHVEKHQVIIPTEKETKFAAGHPMHAIMASLQSEFPEHITAENRCVDLARKVHELGETSLSVYGSIEGAKASVIPKIESHLQQKRAMLEEAENVMRKKRQNTRPLVMSGPSGSGKSTLLKKLFQDFPNSFGFSVSHTTRKPRAGETNGKEYHFVARPDFEADIAANKFIEHAQFSGNLYGTSIAAVDAVAKSGKVCVLDIERQGVQSVKKTNLNARFVFIQPPSVQVLEQRLRLRGSESEESLQKRLAEVEEDLVMAKQKGVYDLVIVNDELEQAYAKLKDYIVREYALKTE